MDVNYAGTWSVWGALDQAERCGAHALQKQMVAEGRFGKKTNRGYYRYE